MKQNKCIRFISCFNSQELSRFEVYVASPYFNTNAHLELLLKYLVSFAPKFEHTNLSYERAYQYVFNKPSSGEDAKPPISKLTSKLLQLAMQFVEQEEFKESPIYAAHFRKKWFRRKSQSQWEQEALRDMKVIHAEYPFQDKLSSWYKYLIDFEQAKTTIHSALLLEKLDLSSLNKNLDLHYLHEKMELVCHLVNHSLITRQTYNIDAIKESLNIILQQQEEHLPAALELWQKALQLLEEPNSRGYYIQLKQGLEDQSTVLTREDHFTLFQYLFNCARFAFPDSQGYSSELISLYKYQIKKNLILLNGHIFPETFYNIIHVFSASGELKMACLFFDEYKEKLDPGNKKSTGISQICESILLFEQAEYEQALDKLNTSFFYDILIKLLERRLRIKIYFELDYVDLLLDQLNAFRKFISVNQKIIPEHHLAGNTAFVNAVSLLVRNKYENKKELSRIATLVMESPFLQEKKWILKRANL